MAASELSVKALREAIRISKENGRLVNFLFSLQPDDPDDPTIHTPLHAACWDPDGLRGEVKIALLFEAANDEGVPLHLLVNARSNVRDPSLGRLLRLGGYTPLHCLAFNVAATQRSIETVYNAWPDAVFAKAFAGSFHATPMDCAFKPYIMGIEHRLDHDLSLRIATVLQCARDANQSVEALLMLRDDFSGSIALIYAVTLLRLFEMNHVFFTLVAQLLRACPTSSYTINYDGMNFLHLAIQCSDEGDECILGLVTRMVSCTSKRDLVAALSTENEVRSELGNTYDETPVCQIHKRGFVKTERFLTQLSRAQRNEDPNWWTLLHYAAANVLCDADPDEKAKRRAERDLRVSANAIFSERLRHPWHVPPEGERQGTKKLIEWLLQVNPQACRMRDSSRRLPLQLALETGKVWDNGVESLVKGYNEALLRRDPSSLLYPFMSAATHPKADITTIYQLLRFDPVVVALCHTGTKN